MAKITRYRGDTVPDQFTLTDADENPVDITGYTFTMTVDTLKTPPDNTTLVYQLTGTITNAAAGEFEFAPSAVQADLTGNYWYDIQMVDGGGAIQTLVKDKYVYTQDITKV